MSNVRPLPSASHQHRKPSTLYSLSTILEPIDIGQLFSTQQPLEVELGSGDGSFLIDWASLHPERNFIGVERLLGRIRKMGRKALKAGLSNVRGIRIESSYFLRWLLPAHSVSALHLYFPDPWPKRKHRRHRLVNEQFPELASRALAADGVVYLRTDDRDYFEQMIAVFKAAPRFVEIQTPEPLKSVLTDFEKDFTARGIATLRAAFTQRLGLKD